ncbi:MAG: gliding motility-associated C-terminal domain-containing protein [Bacteroidales bacterium]|nr:gliding motility-associated C-terminal domain-containing protein [Bacteroidales bacterium]
MSLPWQTTTYIFADSSGRPLDSLTVEVFGMPTVRLAMGRDYIDFDYPVVTLEDLTEGSTWSRWEFSDGSTVTGRKVRRQLHHPLPDSLTVLLTSCNAANCCADTLLTLKTFIRAVWFPNAFTPDADINNRFGVVTNCTATVYTLTVFNRRGEVVFESKEPTTLWDGTTKGVPLPQGAYVYSWFLEDASGFRHSGVGTVTLLR